MKKWVWIVIILIILVGGYFLWLAPSADDADVTGDDATSEAGSPPVDDTESGDEMIDDGVEETGGTDDTSMMEVPTKVTTVSYSASGFAPQQVTIKKGETVMWTNDSENPMWVASAIHPTHEAYPDKTDEDCLGSSFDQCVGSPAGTSWSFTFDLVGEWGYHNHSRATHFGKVIVTE